MNDNMTRYRMPKGVLLHQADNRVNVQPLDVTGEPDARYKQISLPKVPQTIFTDFDGLIHGAWHERSQCMLVLLLLNIKSLQWSIHTPDQNADAQSTCARMIPSKLTSTAFVVGSASSVAVPWWTDPACMVPACDGIHFAFAPGFGAYWQAFFQLGEQQSRMDPAHCIQWDLPDPPASFRPHPRNPTPGIPNPNIPTPGVLRQTRESLAAANPASGSDVTTRLDFADEHGLFYVGK